jgi:hypothetical protein
MGILEIVFKIKSTFEA